MLINGGRRGWNAERTGKTGKIESKISLMVSDEGIEGEKTVGAGDQFFLSYYLSTNQDYV